MWIKLFATYKSKKNMKIELKINGKKVVKDFTLTCEHPCSHYSIPVLIDSYGDVWDKITLALNEAKIIEASEEEIESFKRSQ